MVRIVGYLLLTMAAVFVAADAALAENEGQSALDEATEKKIAAESLQDLHEVVRLTEEALQKGLDDENKKFANNLLAGTLVQRAGFYSAAIFDKLPAEPRWPQLRALALKDLERAIEVDPQLGEAHYLIARLHALPAGDRARARKAIDQAIELTKKEPLVRAKSLTLRANLGDDEKQQLADYAEAIKLAPNDEEAVRSRGLFHLLKGNFDQAVHDFDAAIKLDPEEPATHEARGVALLMLKKYDEAKASLTKAIELNPDGPLPYMHRGRLLAEEKEFQAALEDFNKSLELDGDNMAALLFRARLHQQMKNEKAAREDLDRALQERPGLAPALELRAIVAAGAGDYRQAIKDFEELLKVAPKNPDLLTQIGVLYQVSKRPRAAAEKFTEALEQKEDNFAALRGRGDAYLSVGKQAEAIADYEKAMKLRPDDTGVLNNLAWVLATSTDDKLRDGKRAIEIATKAVELTEQKEAHILSTLAAAYAETGNWDEALKWSRKAGEAGEDSIKDQLKKELASYEQKKPWREKQNEPEAADEAAKDATSGTQSVKKEPADETAKKDKPADEK